MIRVAVSGRMTSKCVMSRYLQGVRWVVRWVLQWAVQCSFPCRSKEEISYLQKLRHPCVVSFVGFARDAGQERSQMGVGSS